MNHIEATIKDLEANVAKLEQDIVRINDEATKMRETADFLRQRLSKPATTPVKSPKPQRREQTKQPTRKRRGACKTFSKYKGVYKSTPLAEGTPRFKACVWLDGTNKNLGVFAIEEEAAAAAAEARGEKDLAAELRELAKKQQGNRINPDQPLGRRRQKAKARTYYVCNHCHFRYETKPLKCPGCDSAAFTKLTE